MNWEDFDAPFNNFTATVFRLETLQDYTAPGEAERIAAFLHGDPRPERSVRTSPWLARIAVSTATQGKRWQRVRVVKEPLTDYTRYELASYVESQAAGEEIRIAPWVPALAGLEQDFWLFDRPGEYERDRPGGCALVLRYSPGGVWEGGDLVTDWDTLIGLEGQRNLALRHSVPLNGYLALIGQRAA